MSNFDFSTTTGLIRFDNFFIKSDWDVVNPSQFNFQTNSVSSVYSVDESGLAERQLNINIESERYALKEIVLTTSVELPPYQFGRSHLYTPLDKFSEGTSLEVEVVFSSGLVIRINPLKKDSASLFKAGADILITKPNLSVVSQFIEYGKSSINGSITWPDVQTTNFSLKFDKQSVTISGVRHTIGVDVGLPTLIRLHRPANRTAYQFSDGSMHRLDTRSQCTVSGIGIAIETYVPAVTDDRAWPVAEIIRDVCERAGVTEDLLNLNDLYEDQYPVYGCFATPENDAFTLIEELQKLHMFDTCNFDGRLNFIKRGGDVVADISLDDLVDSNREIDKRERKDAIEVPRVLNLEYYDIKGDLAPHKQISDRSLDIRAKDEEKQETAVILTADQAKQMATITHKVMIEEQGGGYEFSLPDSYAWLTTGDLIRLDGLRLRIIEVEIDDGLQNYKTVLDRASAYQSSIRGVPPSKPVQPEDETSGDTVFEFLDIPILSDSDDSLLFYSAVNGYDNWRGAGVDLSLDGGANYIDSDISQTPSVIGYLETDLQSGSVYYPDSVNSVRIRMIRDDLELEGATLAQMMNRKNLCVIGNELINFGNATEIEPGLWELDYFLRGRKGTTSEFHAAGERFVMLRRPVLATVLAETYLLNKQLTFRATSVGNDTPSAIKTYLYEGVSQREREPGYLRAVRDNGNIVIRWQGVGRIGAGSNVSQSQYWRGYRVYVNGVAQPDQTTTDLTVADPGGSVTIEVCQLNQFTGEGPRASIEI